MDTRVESLRLLVGDRIATVGIVEAGHADGMIWDTNGEAEASLYGYQAFNSGQAESAAGAGHPLRAIFEQFALEDRALARGGAAPPLEVLLGRLEALLL
jgi:hypothetical protein